MSDRNSIQIRKGTEQDIPTIVGLLKMSLGEGLMPKSETYWRWKHVGNPFGNSPVLLALDGDKLVGVRAFMRWQWRTGNETLQAVRAVDTATHPNYQGRGIFKRLTLDMLNYCHEQKWDFVFNTPNKLSKPGYLRMGWSAAGKLPVRIRLLSPFSMALRALGTSIKRDSEIEDDSVARYLGNPGLQALLAIHQHPTHDGLSTAHTPESLRWRYLDVPVAKYYACGIDSGGSLNALLFYRIKTSNTGTELRVTDIFVNSQGQERDLFQLVRDRCRAHGAHYVTISGLTGWASSLRPFGRAALSVGPVVTIKDIRFDAHRRLANFSGWYPSLGDLELF